MSAPLFSRYLGIDYSGAQTIDASLPGLRVFEAVPELGPHEILPPPGPRRYWSRKGLAEWLLEQLGDGPPTLVGIDHGFSFPTRYFEVHHLPCNWDAFLDDFQHHWPSDRENVYVQCVRDGRIGKGAERTGDARWRRVTEEQSHGGKSVFHFDVPGSVAKSTHAGLPWLRFLRRKLGAELHFWPFDGWTPPPGKSVIAEVYPSLWSRSYPREGRTPDQHDAYSIARWMRETDSQAALPDYFNPPINATLRTVASLEGWILGIRRGVSP